MLTALDIQNKEFSKGLRGYDEEEVDVFLDEVIVDYQSLVERNAALEQELAELKNKLAEYKNTEGSVIRTLESAKILMNDISASAEKRASMIIQNAELEAKNMLGRVEEEMSLLTSKKDKLESEVFSMKIRMKNILEAELEKIELMDSDVLGG